MTDHTGRPTWLRADAGRRRGSAALRLCLIFGIAELLVWGVLGVVKAGYQTGPAAPFLSLFLTYVADHFGDVTIGLATTAYVVFTYHLLESAEAQRRLSAEPFLTLKWYLSSQPAEQVVGSFNKWVQVACEWLARNGIITLDPATLPASEARFLNLELANARDIPVTWLEMQITAIVQFPHERIPIEGKLNLNNLNLARGDRLAVALLDLGPILSTATAYVRIDKLIYGPADASVEVKNYQGNATHDSAGILTLQPPIVSPEIRS